MKVYVVTWASYEWDIGEPIAVFADEEAAEAYGRSISAEREAEHPYCGCEVYDFDLREAS